MRLALVLNKLFMSPVQLANFNEKTKGYKNGIDIIEAVNNVGKDVTICARVYNVRFTPTITQINLGAKFPNNPLTVVIFAKSYAKFNGPLDELFADKNVCVKGTVELYRGKPQIIIDNPENLIKL